MARITMSDIAVMSVQYVHYSFEYYLDSLVRCGLKKIDLWGAEPHYCRLDYSSSHEAELKIAAMRTEIEARDLSVAIYTPETLGYPFNFSDPNSGETARTIEYFKWAFEDAQLFGCDKVFINSGCGLRDVPREDSWKRCVEVFARISELADEHDMVLTLEQLQPYESNLVLTLEDIIRMIEEVGSKRLKCCVDLVAMEVADESLEEYLLRLGEKIAWVHYSDSHHLVLGDGDFGASKLRSYIDILERHGYSGCIDLEINDSIYWEDPHDSIYKSAEYLRKTLRVPEK